MQSEVDDFLEHFGTKGMRWGVRKARGSKAHSVVEDANRKAITARAGTKKKRRTLSNDEINDFIKRLEQEKKLKALIDEDISPGKQAVKKILGETGKSIFATAARGAGTMALNKIIKNSLGPEAAANLAPIKSAAKKKSDKKDDEKITSKSLAKELAKELGGDVKAAKSGEKKQKTPKRVIRTTTNRWGTVTSSG